MADLRRTIRRAMARPARPFGELLGVDTTRPAAALTFDDGPDPVWTPALLEVLARHRVPATFFMVGANAAARRELSERVCAAGHELGCHTYSHRSLVLERPERFIEAHRWCRTELKRGAAALPAPTRWVRAPYGHLDAAVAFDAASCRMRLVGWDAPAADWDDDDPEVLVRRVTDRLRPGSIVLFHDRLTSANDVAFVDRAATVAAVDELLGETAREGWTWLTLSDLLKNGAPRQRWHWPTPDPATLAPHRLIDETE